MINLETATIVDVRTPQEYQQGHYPGSINIPLDQVEARIVDFKEMKKPIVAYCRSGSRSAMATTILKQKGINEVYNGGGLEAMMSQLKTH